MLYCNGRMNVFLNNLKINFNFIFKKNIQLKNYNRLQKIKKFCFKLHSFTY